MAYLLYTVFFLSCIVLVISILLQPGRVDAGALFTSNISSTAFGPRSATTVLAKITIVTAIIFFLSALLLSIPSITGEISVLQTSGVQTQKETTTEEVKQLTEEVKKEEAKQGETKQPEGEESEGPRGQ